MKQKFNNSRKTRSSSVAGLPTVNQDESKMKIYTHQQLSQHNTSQSAWIAVQDNVYDVTPYIKKHPGGDKMILLAAGREITDFLRSHHPFTDKPYKVLKKYHIGKLEKSEYPTYAPDTGFYKECREKVGDYFAKNKISHHAIGPGLRRFTFFSIIFLISFYGSIHPQPFGMTLPNFWYRVALAVVFGVFQALSLMHILHDSLHCSFGGSPKIWNFFGGLVTSYYAGASPESWYHQHSVGHHIFTNLEFVDPDLPATKKGDMRRLVHSQLWTWMYKFQYLYILPLYGLLIIKFRFQDVAQVFTGKNGNIRVNPAFRSFFGIFFPKLVWASWRIGMPLLFWNTDPWTYLTLFFISEMITGYYLAFNFQVSHISDEADFPIADPKTNTFNDEWAISQVKTSVDYHHDSWRVALLSGALNYQTIHHLFPTVSQYHYPDIAPIVKGICKKYNVKFNHLPSYTQAFSHHVKHLYDLGQQGKAAHID